MDVIFGSYDVAVNNHNHRGTIAIIEGLRNSAIV